MLRLPVWIAPLCLAIATEARGLDVRALDFPVNDLLYVAAHDLLLASLPSGAGFPIGNSIAEIDPATGEIRFSVWVGSEPGRLAVSDDGSTLYVGIDGAWSMRSVALPSMTPGPPFWLAQHLPEIYQANDLLVKPGDPGLVAVAIQERDDGLLLFRQGLLQDATSLGPLGREYKFLKIALGRSPNEIFGVTGDYLGRVNIDGDQITAAGFATNLGTTDLAVHEGRVFLGSGAIFDAETLVELDRYEAFGQRFEVDPELGLIYYLEGPRFEPKIRVLDLETGDELALETLVSRTRSFGFGTRITRYQDDGLAVVDSTEGFLVTGVQAIAAPEASSWTLGAAAMCALGGLARHRA